MLYFFSFILIWIYLSMHAYQAVLFSGGHVLSRCIQHFHEVFQNWDINFILHNLSQRSKTQTKNILHVEMEEGFYQIIIAQSAVIKDFPLVQISILSREDQETCILILIHIMQVYRTCIAN